MNGSDFMGGFGINNIICKGLLDKHEDLIRGVSKYISSLTQEDVNNLVITIKEDNKEILRGGIR